jgi:hypothetical protein
MAVNFGLIAQVPSFAQRFTEGQQAAVAEQERNALRQMQAEQMAMQRENMLAQRGEREALAAQRRAQDARAAQRQQFLTGAAEALAQGGHKLDRPTLMKVLQSGVQADEASLIQFAREGLKALDEEDQYRSEAARFGLPGAGAPAPTAARPPAAAFAAPVAPSNLLAGTPFDIGAAAPPRANALAAPPAPAGVSRDMVQQMLLSPNARIREQAKALAATLEKPERGYEPTEIEKLTTALRAAPPGSPEAQALQARIRMLTTREPREPREPALRTTKVELADGSIGVMNLDTGAITPATVGGQVAKGKPSAFAEKTTAQRKQLGLDLDRAIAELTEATKKGGLIDQSTGSGAGRLVDIGAAFVGSATPGAIAAGKLAPIADLVLKMVPRFEGPQSDKDTKSYKEAAGQLADSSLPNEIRKQAGLVILRLMRERKNQFISADMAVDGVGANPAAAPTPNIDALLNKYK